MIFFGISISVIFMIDATFYVDIFNISELIYIYIYTSLENRID